MATPNPVRREEFLGQVDKMNERLTEEFVRQVILSDITLISVEGSGFDSYSRVECLLNCSEKTFDLITEEENFEQVGSWFQETMTS